MAKRIPKKFVLDPHSFMVTYQAGLVAKGVIGIEDVSEAMGLRQYVTDVLREMGYFDSEEVPEEETENIVSSDEEEVLLEENETPEEKVNPALPPKDQDDAHDIDPVDSEFKPEGSVEDNEVRGIGRATEVEPQPFNEESEGKGGFLPR